MSEQKDYRQMIDDYLSGNLSTSERDAFEARLEKDSAIKNEFEFQKSIVNQIRESRRLELKTRLDNINVHWYHSIPGSWKVAAAVSILTVSSLSAYFYIDQRFEDNVKLDLEYIDQVEFDRTTENIPEKPAINLLEEETATNIEKPEQSEQPVTARKEESATDKKPAETETTAKPAEDYHVDIAVPDDFENEFEGANNLDMNEAAGDHLDKMSPSVDNMSSNLGVETIQHKKYNFHYKMGNDQLTLYGNFNEIPYEILEINSKEGKRFYLKYRNNFYPLAPAPQVTELKPVTDESLLNELKIVEENK